MSYYPDRIDDDQTSCGSAEIEGGGAGPSDDPSRTLNSGPLHLKLGHDVGEVANDGVGGSPAPSPSRGAKPWDKNKESVVVEDFDAMEISRHPDRAGQHPTASNGLSANDVKDQLMSQREAVILNERERRRKERRRGMGGMEDGSLPSSPTPSSVSSGTSGPATPGGVMGNIRGWFGKNSPGRTPDRSPYQARKQLSMEEDAVPVLPLHSTPKRLGDDSSFSSSDEASSDEESDSVSRASNAVNDDARMTPQERARARALQYLSNSCVDAGRMAKTASYVWGLERMDLKRKRDRYEKELEVVEAEMNKDRGLTQEVTTDPIAALASKLCRELPRIQGADAGAGAGSGLGDQSYMLYEEYAVLVSGEDISKQPASVWENKEAVDVYIASLQRRLKEVLERTKSLEKRLVVLEQAGDDIVSSLCEDLSEVTAQSNRQEGKYVKRGKGLQRRLRREETRHRRRMKEAEKRVRELEEQLMRVSGGDENATDKLLLDVSDSSNDSSLTEDDDADDDEVLLEKKLTIIKAKRERDKEEHQSEVDSVRRQCEQLKLRLSVARLVMEGDDNLREYVGLLERFNPSSKNKRKSAIDDAYGDPDDSFGHANVGGPPSRITRARAKLLKVTHLERIYEQRLTVSKSFTDATINALEEELSEREQATQKMEVRCLNELMLIDSGIKDIVSESDAKMASLKGDAQELADAIAAYTAEKSITDINSMFAAIDTPYEHSIPLVAEDPIAADDDSSGESSDEDEADKDADELRMDSAEAVEERVERSSTGQDAPLPLMDGVIEDGKGPVENGVSFDENHIAETPAKGISQLRSLDSQEMANLETLGCDLKSTFEEYQTSFDQSSSKERIERLEHMNDLVIKIAQARGIECTASGSGREQMKSWSRKKSRNASDKERREKKRRSKKKKKKKRRRREKERREKAKDASDAANTSLRLADRVIAI
ncbi:hypothetical protein ACHAXT_010340 [Thalassiosira profunda]